MPSNKVVLMHLKDQKIFITGGSGGIGAEVAREATRQGASIALSYHQGQQKAENLLKELNLLIKKNQKEPLAVTMDINNADSVAKACEDVLKHFDGKIDGVVNNAGTLQDQLLLRMSFEEFQMPIKTNLYGCYLVSKFFLKAMLKARKGAFVHIISINGQRGQAGQANYAASKAGIEAFSKSLAREMAARGIRSNCVAPGLVNTNMIENLTQKKEILAHIPLKRIAEPIDIATPVCFLLSDAAGYITGHTLNVNGGLLM